MLCAKTYTHLPKVSGQNVDHINFRDVFVCFTQKYSKTSKKTLLIALSECSQKIRKNIFLLVPNTPKRIVFKQHANISNHSKILVPDGFFCPTKYSA